MISVLNVRPLFIAYFLFLILITVLPLNTKSELNHVTILQFRGDYFLHAVLFFPFLPLAWSGRQELTIFLRKWVLPSLLTAAMIEGLQYFIPYRAFNVNDILANFAGITLGTAALIIKQRYKGL